MFLKSLTLKGFKSFADATTLDFEPGVTVVVGPNGSGKSNIVDAVAWVLGAQGPRALRSAKMEDVIFAGTPQRAALGRAEVSLTIDNTSGALPIEFSEVTVTRTLFRSGESEYAINRVPCRLLDVQELLSDTGVGRQQHVIVSQGNLDAVLDARPEDRRMIIEEAAGILKYRRRKEKSERRLESTEASLTRLQDLQREVRRQLRPLERQAAAARRHDGLLEELTGLRRHLAGLELGSIEERLISAARTRSELAGAEQEVRAALSRLDADVIAAEADVAVARARDERADLGEALSRAEALRARSRGLIALLDERRRSIERDRAAAVDQGVGASLEADAADLAAQLSATAAEAEALVPQADELADADARVDGETAAFDQQWRQVGPTPANPGAEVRSELGALRAVVERGGSELHQLESRSESLTLRSGRLAAEVERLGQVVVECDQQGVRLADAKGRAYAVLAEREADQSAAQQARRDADAGHHRWSARAEALSQALDEARARAGVERLAAVDGVVGTLLELVEVSDGLETAFEAAAGEAIAAVVVDGEATARRALDELTRLGANGAVMAPGDPPGPCREPTNPPTGSTLLRDHVRAWLPGVDSLVERLIGAAVVVDGGWADALDVAVARPDLVVVTRRGDRCAGGLWRTGASGSGATGAALAEARDEAERWRAGVEERDEELAAAASALGAARTVHANARRAVDANDSRRRASLEAMRRAEMQSQEAQSDAAAGAHRALAERAARQRMAERVAAVAALRRDLEVRAAAIEERRTMLTRRQAEVGQRLRRHAAERSDAAVRHAQLALQGTATDRLATSVTSTVGEIDRVIDALRAARRADADADRVLTEHLDQLRRRRSTAERQLSELRERSGRATIEQAEARVRLEALTDAVRRDLDCEPEATRHAPCPTMPPGTSPASRVQELERELRLMGPINPLALEEHEALKERGEFLEAQLDDVRSARRELGKVIRAVDAEIIDVFRAAWADVAESFDKLFSTLFPGGQGRLRLTDPDHLLDTGIEIEARPSGKNVRRLSLLSGGERSLTAMAYLFAVFRSRPSPFYLMDEVEAALDDVNLHRFLDLLAEFRAEAQLLVVSHQKRTMEAADCLYGVTMAPGGSSRVISERVAASA